MTIGINQGVVTLKSGLRLVNFSSPHAFEFDDGSVLPACDEAWARGLMLKPMQHEYPTSRRGISFTDIVLKFRLTSGVCNVLAELQNNDEVDLIIVPLPVMQAVREENLFDVFNKIRVIRITDRVTKVCRSDVFCI